MAKSPVSANWLLEGLTPPWGSLPSIYEHVQLHASDPLPDDPLVQEKAGLRWSGGAWDGVLGHHWRGSDPPPRAFEIVIAVRSFLDHPNNTTMVALYRLVVQETLLPSIDLLLRELTESLPSLNQTRLLELGRYFATQSGHREAVKFGLALIGLVGTSEDIDVLRIIGTNEEFTSYAAVALAHVAPEPEHALWDLAQRVHNWGRIHIVERLKETQNADIQTWMLREGFRNGVMNEYLACICARTGKLHLALKQQYVDDSLLDGAADIIRALIAGGPAEGIDDYAQAGDACEAYANCIWSRRKVGLKHFITVALLRGFLSQPDGWDERQSCGWNSVRRATVASLSDDVFSWPTWPSHVFQALSSSDDREFYEADEAACWLRIDTWQAHFDRVKAAPVTSKSWYRLMQETNESRIEAVLTLAESGLPLDQIATGPSTDLGLGLGSEPEQALGWVLQDLHRFSTRGWKLIATGLRSRVIRNRHMAIRALAAWPQDSWPIQARGLLREACDGEPDDRVKRRLSDLLGST